MAECHTCGKVVDIEATVCSGCGRPNPAKMRKGEGCSSVVSVVVIGAIVIIALMVRTNTRNAPPVSSSTTPQTASAPVSEPHQSSPQPTSDFSNRANVGESDLAGSNEEITVASSQENEHTPATTDSDAMSVFPYSAHLVDPDGKVVIQSRASMFSKNVESVATGTHVQAASKDGKWISVQLDNGNVGFVRQRQLQFD